MLLTHNILQRLRKVRPKGLAGQEQVQIVFRIGLLEDHRDQLRWE